jgi:phosphoribosylformimino-5-aminoimidazole carboxamide ribotide isomerase
LDIYPAIDIHAGRVVRASRRSLEGAFVYHPDPLALALAWEEQGARWIHLVDLDRAFGVGDQSRLVASLVRRLGIPVQVGGGMWRPEDVAVMRDAGVQRILLGARAASDEAVLEVLLGMFASDSLGLALDVSGGSTWSRDWADAASHPPVRLARRAVGAGIGVLAVTELAREGRLAGVELSEPAALMEATGAEVLVSGGVAGIADLESIRDLGLSGAIVGRALMEGRLTLAEALACSSSS